MRRLACIACAAACLLRAQDDAAFKSETRLVEIYATVFDHSHPVEGLTRNQFEIKDNGSPQPIQIFEAADQSLSCAILLDTTGSMAAEMPVLRNAGRAFIEALKPADSVAVFAFNDHVELLSEMNSDKTSARRALTRLRAGGKTALFDAITTVALKLERRPGKKVIVVMTDGGDNASALNRQSAVGRARKAGIPVFAIAEGNALTEVGATKLLHELAESTGGHMYRANRAKDMTGIFSEIASDLEAGYLLAFQPVPDAVDPLKWHSLEVSVKDSSKSLKVRARAGYSLE